ncbi:MAG TPA: glutathione S-transferase family protein [Caulobacteraceae bacterium]|jgi:glutathione S-transferase|nr:glutathione S-transferase family protein [Caulobacteraceae bacterium]
MSELVLYRAPHTRSISTLWLLEELGVAYRMETVRPHSPECLAVNPRGWVPMIVDGETRVTETPAICLYLADRYGYGTLAPKLEDPARGPYTSWTVWSTAVLEPASTMVGHEFETARGSWGFGFGRLEQELEVLEAALAKSDYLAGDRFTAADVMVATVVGMRFHTSEVPRRPALVDYVDRLNARPAWEKAAAINWPPRPTPAA